MIIMDSREPAELAEVVNRALPGEVEIALLETGDFIIFDEDGCCVGIERKTTRDFLNSFSSGRLVNQVNRLRASFRPILLLEGNYTLTDNMRIRTGGFDTGWHHSAIQMAMLAIQREGVIVLWTPDHRGTADTLRILNKRAKMGCAMAGAHSLLDVWLPSDRDALVRATAKPVRRRRKGQSEGNVPPAMSIGGATDKPAPSCAVKSAAE